MIVLFDFTLRLDTVLQGAAMLAGGGLVFGALRSDLRALTERVKKVEKASDAQTQVLVAIATQDQRLDDIERRVGKIEG